MAIGTHRRRLAVALFSLGMLGGCLFFKSPLVPMRSLYLRAPAASSVRGSRPERPLSERSMPMPLTRREGVVVLLPGFGDTPEHFVRHGFVDSIHRRTGFDVIAPDAHFGYYRDMSVLPRLERDVMASAEVLGYERIWLVGVSMGGFGALAYALEHPDQIEGVILIAPYLGLDVVIDEVRQAGGLLRYRGHAPRRANSELEKTRQIWAWLAETVKSSHGPRLYVGYGEADPSRLRHRVLADALPRERVVVVPGGHKWTVFAPTFEKLLAQTPLVSQ